LAGKYIDGTPLCNQALAYSGVPSMYFPANGGDHRCAYVVAISGRRSKWGCFVDAKRQVPG